MIFTGEVELNIDPKQRLAVPAKIRARLDPAKDGTAWYCVPWGSKRLMLYTERRFEELAEAREKATLTPDEDEAMVASSFYGMCERLEMDSAGRIVIPRAHQELAGLSTNVVLVGAGKYLVIWDRETWNSGKAERNRNLPAAMKQLQDQGKAANG